MLICRRAPCRRAHLPTCALPSCSSAEAHLPSCSSPCRRAHLPAVVLICLRAHLPRSRALIICRRAPCLPAPRRHAVCAQPSVAPCCLRPAVSHALCPVIWLAIRPVTACYHIPVTYLSSHPTYHLPITPYLSLTYHTLSLQPSLTYHTLPLSSFPVAVLPSSATTALHISHSGSFISLALLSTWPSLPPSRHSLRSFRPLSQRD